jgi:ribosomal protein S18 acetylase RimI-like enzyme
MTIVREMREEDADAIRTVEASAFGAWWKQLKGESVELPQRTRTIVQANRERDPGGCFVAQVEERVVGFIFSRTWGSVGWFGTFSVLPEYQGRGIGKQLIAASVDYMRRAPQPGRVIGLETMPDSPYNLGLYLRLGFQARFLTFLLGKTMERSVAGDVDLPHWSAADAETQECWLAHLRKATGQIQPGLDYSKEIISTARHNLGETLVLTEGATVIGSSTVWLESVREGTADESAIVQVLTLHPAHTNSETFRALIEASETLACARGKQKLALPVNACHAWALEQLLRWGYRIERALVRMVLQGTDEGPSVNGHVNCSRWAG